MSLPVEIWQLIADMLWPPDRARLCLAVCALYARECAFVRAFILRLHVHVDVRGIIHRVFDRAFDPRRRQAMPLSFSIRMISRTYIVYMSGTHYDIHDGIELRASASDWKCATVKVGKLHTYICNIGDRCHDAYSYISDALGYIRDPTVSDILQAHVGKSAYLSDLERHKLTIALGRFYYYRPIDFRGHINADALRAQHRITRKI